MSALSAIEVARSLATGALSARSVADACLERIASREAEVQAFAFLDPDAVRRHADRLDAHRKAGRPLGPLHGVPVAVKDIIDTADMPTENGTVLDKDRRPAQDATIVTRLRAAGALIVGKTVTAELAFSSPGKTRNPHNLEHTPGGSSSGSAAAVADGMVPLAIGTQTAGSVIRPAAFCGVVGFKPTYGTISLHGVLKVCEPLDTAGVFASNLNDAALLAEVLQGFDPADPRTAPPRAPQRLVDAADEMPPVRPTIAVVRGPTWPMADADTVGLIEEITDALGARADAVALPDVFDNAQPARLTIMKTNMARNFRPYRTRGEEQLSTIMRNELDEGAAVSAVDYLSALDWQTALKDGILPIFQRYDAILTPSAPGTAPASLSSTGAADFNFLWTMLGIPSVTLPVARGSNGLPLGVQLVGRAGEDARLMRVANWLQRTLQAA